MQYGLEVLPYKREKKGKTAKASNRRESIQEILKYVCLFSIMFLVTRVKLMNDMAPFGIALLICFTTYTDRATNLVLGVATILGYVSLIGKADYLGIYLIAVGTIMAFQYIVGEIERNKRLIILNGVILLEFLICNMFILELSFGISFISSMLQIVCIVPLYFILDNGITCIKKINTKHLFSNEEIISIGILVALVVAGTWGISVKGISLMNVFALTLIASISYVCGSSIGATTGVAIGLVVGMCTDNILVYITMYAICGLITGIFKELGKWMSGLAFLVSYFVVEIYLVSTSTFTGLEGVISIGIFYLISESIYHKLALDLNAEEKKVSLSDEYSGKLKALFCERLDNFSNLLTDMSKILNNLVDNDKLAMKKKSSALVQCLADRVCSSCDMNSMCWKRELHYTYSAFSEIIQNLEENRRIIPKEIERKCTHRSALLRNAEEIMTKHMMAELRRSSLCEGREMLATQISNMSNTLKELGDNFIKDVKINTVVENDIRKILEKAEIKYEDILCYENKKGSLTIKLALKPCRGKHSCSKKVLPLISKATGMNLVVVDKCCNINFEKNTCNVTIEEAPKYHVTTYGAVKCKEGEKCNGDTYSYDKLKDGSYLCLLSDGMGSGPQAGRESSVAVELINEFMKAGFDKLAAINGVNSIMSMKFNEEEKFTTLDLANIKMDTGEVEFMKVGAVSSFIKSSNDVDVIKSKSLPIGVLDNADVEVETRKLKNGDFLVMVSDGIVDCQDDIGNERWIIEYLKHSKCTDPKDIANAILNEAIRLSNYKIKDDMTVLVSKIYALN